MSNALSDDFFDDFFQGTSAGASSPQQKQQLQQSASAAITNTISDAGDSNNNSINNTTAQNAPVLAPHTTAAATLSRGGTSSNLLGASASSTSSLPPPSLVEGTASPIAPISPLREVGIPAAAAQIVYSSPNRNVPPASSSTSRVVVGGGRTTTYFDDDDDDDFGSYSDRDRLTKAKGANSATNTKRVNTCASFTSATELQSHHGDHDDHHDHHGHDHGHSHGGGGSCGGHGHDDDHGHGHSHGGGSCGGGHGHSHGAASSSSPCASSHHSPRYVDPWAASPNTAKTIKARKALTIAIGFCACFMVIELIAGVAAHSIALVNDAVHMLTDVFNLGISLTAVILSVRAPTMMMSFGYGRAEVIGALASVFTTWMLVVWILVEAGQRIYGIVRCADGSAEDALCEAIDSRLMLGVGICGFFANIGCLFILMWGGHHGHSHGVLGSGTHGGCGGGHDHGHSHSGGGDHNHSHGDDHHDHDNHHSDHGGNMNLRGAILHVIGDCLQSLGVVVAAALIWAGNHAAYGEATVARSYYNLADPFCSILFAVITVTTTFNLIKDVLVLLMEGCPKTLAATAGPSLKAAIGQLEGVKEVRGFHVWLLGTERSMCLVHVVVDAAPSLSLLEDAGNAASDAAASSPSSSSSPAADGVKKARAHHTVIVDTVKRLATKANVGFCSVEVTYE